MEMTSKLGSGPQTAMPTYTEWVKKEGLRPANPQERQKCYLKYIETFMDLINHAATVPGFDYVLEFFHQYIEHQEPATADECDAYEVTLNDFSDQVNAATQAHAQPQQPGPVGETMYLNIPIETAGLTLSDGGKNMIDFVFNEGDLGLRCLNHYSVLYSGGKAISANDAKKLDRTVVKIYVVDVEMQMGSIAKNQTGPGGQRIDFQPYFTLKKTAGGPVFQSVCTIFAKALKGSKQIPSDQAAALKTFCNTCLAFAAPIHLANWQTQMGAQGAKQNSYSAVLMGEGVEIPLATFIEAHFLSARKSRRCYILVLPPLVVAALRSLGLYDEVMRVIQAAWQ